MDKKRAKVAACTIINRAVSHTLIADETLDMAGDDLNEIVTLQVGSETKALKEQVRELVEALMIIRNTDNGRAGLVALNALAKHTTKEGE